MNLITLVDESAAVLPSYDPDVRWWQPDPASRIEANQVARALDCDEMVALRLIMHGSSAQQVADYLNPAPKHVVSPEATCPGMTAAARALIGGIERGETIAVYGDYDVDGATSLAILRDTLDAFDADVFVGSANAVSGFGLTQAFVEAAAVEGSKWLITVDCGSTQSDPVRLAQSLGMTVIVIDHHDVDVENPCEHHLNPRLRSIRALTELAETLNYAEDSRQSLDPAKNPGEQIAKITERSDKILCDALGKAHVNSLKALSKRHWTNVGALLSWKFTAQMLTLRHGKVPASHWGRAMYLAGLGAVADMAPLNDLEIRAFVRIPTDLNRQRNELRNRVVVPLGVQMLCEALGENPLRPDNMIRSKALMNLPKRTSEIDAAQIQTLLRSTDHAELSVLVPHLVGEYLRISSIRRDEMDPAAAEYLTRMDLAREVEIDPDEREPRTETYMAYPVIDDVKFLPYSGFSRMVSNTSSRTEGKPTIAFVRKTVIGDEVGPRDEFGQELFKYSGSNANVPEAHLGELISDPAMRAASTIRMRDWLGNEAMIENLGGHLEVVSGVCTRENIPAVIAACEAWAALKDRKRKWRPVVGSRPRVVVRKVEDTRFARLEREAELLAPFAFPHAPMPMVSIVGVISELEIGDDTRTHAVLTTDNGMDRPVTLHADAVKIIEAFPNVRFECVVALGNPDQPYYLKTLVACPE